MLPRNHLDRIHITFDDHRLVNNAGLLLPATVGLAWPGELWHTREVHLDLDLNAASRETLLEIIAGQRAVIADLQRRIGVLECVPTGAGRRGCRVISRTPAWASAGEKGAQKAAPPWLRPPAHDSYPAGGACRGLSRLRDAPERRMGTEFGKSLSYRTGSGRSDRARPGSPHLSGMAAAPAAQRPCRGWFWASSAWGSIW